MRFPRFCEIAIAAASRYHGTSAHVIGPILPPAASPDRGSEAPGTLDRVAHSNMQRGVVSNAVQRRPHAPNAGAPAACAGIGGASLRALSSKRTPACRSTIVPRRCIRRLLVPAVPFADMSATRRRASIRSARCGRPTPNACDGSPAAPGRFHLPPRRRSCPPGSESAPAAKSSCTSARRPVSAAANSPRGGRPPAPERQLESLPFLWPGRTSIV